MEKIFTYLDTTADRTTSYITTAKSAAINTCPHATWGYLREGRSRQECYEANRNHAK